MNFKSKIIAPDKAQVFAMESYYVWGASVIRSEDGRYHMFASRWKKEYTFFGWLTCSEIIHAVSDKMQGPFSYVNTLDSLMEQSWASKMAHNPTIKKCGDKYYLYYIGTTYADDIPKTPQDFSNKHDVISHEARYNQKIGVAVSTSLDGEFIPSEANPILDKRENNWDSTFVSNPSIFLEDDGTIRMIYKAKLPDQEKLILGAALAHHPEGPFERTGPSPLFDYDIEDPFIWKQDNTYYMLAKDMRGTVVDKHDGILFTSLDGLNFVLADNKLAWTHDISFTDGASIKPLFVERPQLYIEDGKPACLYTAIAINRQEESYNLARLLKKE